MFLLCGIAMVGVLAGCAGQMVLRLPSEIPAEPAAAKGYVGAQACATCHEQIYNHYRDHGHPKKLRPAAEVRAWGMPLPDGYTWDDISYVIGGATRKARYINQQGYIITKTGPSKDKPGKNQYNTATGRWVDYEAGKVTKYDCGPCPSTTAYSKDGNQDGRPGMGGDLGLSRNHLRGVPRAGQGARGRPQQDQRQGGSVRYGLREVPYSRRQGAHPGRRRIHFPPRAVQRASRQPTRRESHLRDVSRPPQARGHSSRKLGCEDCHIKEATDFKGSRHEKSLVQCTECHMPAAGKSAESFGKYVGDIKTHIFKISLGPTDEMFTPDGKFATGKLTADFACLNCHASRDKAWAAAQAKGIHARGK